MSVPSKWLARLRALENPETRGGTLLTKPTEPPFVSFVSTPPPNVLENSAANLPDLEAFEERAAILEFDGGLTREAAERQAAREVSSDDLPNDPAMTRRRAAVLAVLREHPERHRHVAFDPDAEPGTVLATVAVRMVGGGIATGELRIPADRYNPFAIIAVLQQADQ